jgi:hypothetical protein
MMHAVAQGIWRPIYIEHWTELRLARAHAAVQAQPVARARPGSPGPVLPTGPVTVGSVFTIAATLTADWAGAASAPATLSVQLEGSGLSVAVPVTLHRGEQSLEAALAVPETDVALWYAPH